MQPAAHEFGRLYAREYFTGGDVRCGHVDDYFAERTALLSDAMALLADAIDPAVARATGGRPGRLLELGCATGVLLEAAQRRGWIVQGVEYSADAAAEAGAPRRAGVRRRARRRGAAPTRRTTSRSSATCSSTCPIPPPCCARSRACSRPAARSCCADRWPRTRSRAASAWARRPSLGRTWRLDEPPYHLWEFTPGPLRALITGAGLAVESFVQSKTPPATTRRRGALVGPVLNALDTVNVAWTHATNALGDRCMVVARRPGGSAR